MSDNPEGVDPLRKLLHDLNNDLSLIMGHLELAQVHASGNEKLLKKIDSSRQAAVRMAARIRETQEKSRANRGG